MLHFYWLRRKPCSPKGAPVKYHPVIWPAGLMAAGSVSGEPVTSNVVIVPSVFRRKPCSISFASRYHPVILLVGLMAVATVWVAPVTSNVVIVPSVFRRKPCTPPPPE